MDITSLILIVVLCCGVGFFFPKIPAPWNWIIAAIACLLFTKNTRFCCKIHFQFKIALQILFARHGLIGDSDRLAGISPRRSIFFV